jgi:hypothetical protein
VRSANGRLRRTARAAVLGGFAAAAASVGGFSAAGVAAAQTVDDLAVVEAYEQVEFRDAGQGLTARYAAVDAPEGERREINVLQIPLGGQAGDVATAQFLNGAAEGFAARAEKDCAEVERRPLAAAGPGGAVAVEVVCEGFGPQGGAGSDVNSYLYARFEERRGSLVVISYQWRSARAAAASVPASDLRTREIEPRIAEIRQALDGRLSD